MRDELAAAYRDIVKGFVEGAKSGSCAHVKLAGELLEEPEKKPRRTTSSASRLMAQLLKEDKKSKKAQIQAR
jgi:hypothetical protein